MKLPEKVKKFLDGLSQKQYGLTFDSFYRMIEVRELEKQKEKEKKQK